MFYFKNIILDNEKKEKINLQSKAKDIKEKNSGYF